MQEEFERLTKWPWLAATELQTLLGYAPLEAGDSPSARLADAGGSDPSAEYIPRRQSEVSE